MLLISSLCGVGLILCIIGFFKQRRTLKKLNEELIIEKPTDDTLDEKEGHLLKQILNWSHLCFSELY
jgi:hypothetical protein